MKMVQWLKNEPQGLNQKAFVDRMMGTIGREKATVEAQMKRAQFTRLAPFENLRAVDPERFNEVLMSAGVDPKEYDEWRAAGHVQASAVQSPEGARRAGAAAPASDAITKLQAAAKAGNAKAQAYLKSKGQTW
jgi:hypothetical protein